MLPWTWPHECRLPPCHQPPAEVPRKVHPDLPLKGCRHSGIGREVSAPAALFAGTQSQTVAFAKSRPCARKAAARTVCQVPSPSESNVSKGRSMSGDHHHVGVVVISVGSSSRVRALPVPDASFDGATAEVSHHLSRHLTVCRLHRTATANSLSPERHSCRRSKPVLSAGATFITVGALAVRLVVTTNFSSHPSGHRSSRSSSLSCQQPCSYLRCGSLLALEPRHIACRDRPRPCEDRSASPAYSASSAEVASRVRVLDRHRAASAFGASGVNAAPAGRPIHHPRRWS